MNSDRLKEILNKIPFSVLLLAYIGYLGFDYQTFTTDPASPLVSKQGQVESIKADTQKLQSKLKEANEFLASLEGKKLEIRKLAQELEEVKDALSENLDIPEFMKTAVTEATKVGLRVVSIKPTESTKHEFYAEQAFEMTFSGVYVQLLVFLERMSNVQKIVRVDNFAIRPRGSASSKYVELEGIVELKVYRYLAASPSASPATTAPASAGQQGKPGGGP